MKKDFSNDDFAKLYTLMMNEFKSVDKKFERIDERLDRIVQILDKSAADYKTLVEENAAGAGATRRIDDVLEDHETRIEQLENLELGRDAA